jgi:phospholipid transport system transporter-binding protein
MSEQASFGSLVSVSPGVYRLEAPLTFASVAQLRKLGLSAIDSAPNGLTIELHAVPSVDSAGLALLIDWLASARAQSRTLNYASPPPSLLSLARLSEVDKLIAG